jgi:hypothetical protein
VVAEAPEVVSWRSRPAHLEALAAVLRFPKTARVVAVAAGTMAGLEP